MAGIVAARESICSSTSAVRSCEEPAGMSTMAKTTPVSSLGTMAEGVERISHTSTTAAATTMPNDMYL